MHVDEACLPLLPLGRLYRTEEMLIRETVPEGPPIIVQDKLKRPVSGQLTIISGRENVFY